jgi:hypothetical protein
VEEGAAGASEGELVLDDFLAAKMHLVDLAGSERAKRTKAEGARLKVRRRGRLRGRLQHGTRERCNHAASDLHAHEVPHCIMSSVIHSCPLIGTAIDGC